MRCTKYPFRKMVNTELIHILVYFMLRTEVNGQLKTTCYFNAKCRCKTINETYVEVDCSKLSLSYIPKLPGNVSSVDLSYNNISNIPEQHFKDNNILRKINLSENKLHFLTKKMFYGLNSVLKLVINNNLISKTTKDVFLYLRTLSYLDVKKNNISWSNHNVTFPPSLLKLKIDYNVSHENLPEMPHLEYLDVSGSSGNCYIHTVKPNTFRSVPKIHELDISACKVNYVYNGSFSFMRNLSILNLSFNTCLKFDGLENVTIDLPFTSIKVLKFNKIHKTFEMNTKVLKRHLMHLKQTKLTELHADSNKIQLIEKGTLQELPITIKKIFLSDNEWSYGEYLYDSIVVQAEFVNVSFLFNSRFDIEKKENCEHSEQSCCNQVCEQKKYPDKTIYNLYLPVLPVPMRLKVFHYRGCNLRYELQEAYVSNNMLEYADLSRNIFYSWTGPLLTFKHLYHLDLSDNLCSNVSNVFFKSFPNLKTLLLQNNLLGFILPEDTGGKIMQHIPSLQFVNFTQNRITSLPYSFFKSQLNLKDINLGENMMDNISFQINHMKNLTNLNLSNNRIFSLDENARSQLEDVYKMNNKFAIDLSGNPLKCTCGTKDFIKWITTTKLKIDNENKTYCERDSGNRESLGKSVYEKLQLECSSYSSLIVGTAASLVVFLFVLIWGMAYRNRWRLRYMYYMIKHKYQVQNKGKPDDANQYEYDAFISYENKDRGFVHEKLLHCLEHEAGLKLCIHKRDFLPGNDIAGNITSAIHNSRKVVIVMSHNYLDSYWCMFEYNMAKVESIYSRNKENILFLVFLEQIAPNVLPMMVLELVQSSSYIEYPNDEFGDTVFWDRLREVLSQ